MEDFDKLLDLAERTNRKIVVATRRIVVEPEGDGGFDEDGTGTVPIYSPIDLQQPNPEYAQGDTISFVMATYQQSAGALRAVACPNIDRQTCVVDVVFWDDKSSAAHEFIDSLPISVVRPALIWGKDLTLTADATVGRDLELRIYNVCTGEPRGRHHRIRIRAH